jgi:small-conductance mechanosensitive channel
MVRMFAYVLVVLGLAIGPVWAAATAPTPAPPPGATPAPTAIPAITPAQAAQVLDVLNDPSKRAAFAATLQAIVKGLPAPQAAAKPAVVAPATGLPIRLAPDSIGAQVLMGGSSFLRQAADQALLAVAAVGNLPGLGRWIASLFADPASQSRLLDVGWRIVLAVICGLAAERAIRRGLRRPAAGLEAIAPEPLVSARPGRRRLAGTRTLALRLPVLLARLALGLVPVLGFVVAGHLLAISVLGGEKLAQLAVLAVIDAYALCAAILGTTRLILIPPRPGLRVFAVPEPAAVYAMRWLRRMVVVTVGGYAIAEVGLLFGLSDEAYLALLSLVILFDHACLAAIVLQQRDTVRDWIRAPAGATGTLASLRNGLAAIWHWIALTVLVALWLVRASQVPGGYTRILYLFSVTGAVLLVTWAMRARTLRSLDRVLRLEPTMTSRYPGLETRLHRYRPVLDATAEAVVYIVAVLALLELWGLGAFGWLFASTPGRQLISTIVTVVVTLLLALLVWETADAFTERHLARLAAGGQVARAARLRTLLPMLRTTLLIVILLVAGLMVLGAIGVNTAPMLAGAGIVGLAIGFGSQKLVQDVITGIFLLLENAMQIGDWVTVSGLSGTVEGLSVRTIRLRAGDGSVHVIPFSSVTSVTNTNRGLGNASVSVSVAFAEDTDQVCDVLKDIAAHMRTEAPFETQMLSDLQLWGVDKVDGSEATIAGQIVCTDAGRWAVQREFNRRMKKRLQELGIELYNPLRMLVLHDNTADRTGGAPARARAIAGAKEERAEP